MKYVLIFILFAISLFPQGEGLQIARLKYSGGADWYNDPSSEVNLLKFITKHTGIKTKPEYVFADISSDDIFLYPILFMTGHGNIVFSKKDSDNLRNYLLNGGFLFVDDDYGMDISFRREIKKVFPESELQELPFDYGLYKAFYDFPYGPPKTHQHDDKTPKGYGLFVGNRLVVYYTFETNPSDGWADAVVHNNPENKRTEALKFGTNLVIWAISH